MESEETTGGFKQWVEDNLRLIVSIIIVVAIAGGIYSYSQRSKQTEIALNEDETQEQTLIGSDQDSGKDSDDTKTPDSKEEVKDENAGSKTDEPQEKPGSDDETVKPKEEQKATPPEAPKEEQKATPPEAPKKEEEKRQPQTSSAETSAETADSFIETAGRGDGTTHLARRALAGFLEKTPDSQLTPEHKIYIEDYIRKNVGRKGGLSIGTKVEFSKTLVQDAISKAKTLNEKQLKNLEKYAKRVPSLN